MSNFDDILNNVPTEEQSGGQQLSKEEYAEKKQAEREAIYTLSDNTALEVVGSGDEFKQYLDVQSQFDRYSAVNALLILAQNPDATRLGDFDHWKNKGAFVKSGQTGISILEPGKEYEREDGSKGVSYNIKKVFDISQVDDRKIKATLPQAYTERQLLQALVKSSAVAIVGVENLSEDMGARWQGERIDVRKGMGFDDTFRSLTREMAFVELDKREVPMENAEFTAYCASYLLCTKYGADTKNFSFEDAPGVFDGMEAQDIKGKLSEIRDAAGGISERMAKQLDAVQKAAKNNEAR